MPHRSKRHYEHSGELSKLRSVRNQLASLALWNATGEPLRVPKNIVVVAMANKLRRIAWDVLSRGDDYKPASNLVKA